jgi:NTE family protein
MNSGRELKNRFPVQASVIGQHKQHRPLSRHTPLIILTLLLAITGFIPDYGRNVHALTIVYPDTLDVPNMRYSIIPAMRPMRKTVGLALSGGGANGFSQIGVLKALDEENIPIDFIAGTSIGALVGGLYSAGYTAPELEVIANTLPLKNLFSLDNDAPRTNSYLEQKSIRDRASIAIRFDGFRLVLPKSLSSAQNLTKTLDLLILNAPYHATHDFSDLPVKFRAVTTDLVSGRRITLTSGPLSEAMRASSTIPILYQPIERNGLKLADGGLVANLPVDELVAAGAEYKIAVDSHGRMYKDGDDIDNPLKAADQAMTILTQVQYPVQLDLADIIIAPDLGDHKATDISDIRRLIDAGYAKGKLLASTISRNIQVQPTRDIDITRYSKTIQGIPDSPACFEQKRTANGIVRNASRAKATLHELLATDLFSRVYAEIDQRQRTIVFVLMPLPRIDKVEVTGGPAEDVTEKERNAAFKAITGTLYTNAIATNSLEKLVKLYRNKGYSLVGIDGTSIDGSRLRVRLSSGRVDVISISQDRNITRATPVRRELEIDSTRVLQLANAEKSIDNLYGTGVFSRVSLSAESQGLSNGKQPSRINLRLDEKPATVLRLGLRYDETSNAQMLLDFRNENLNGTANSIGGWAKFSQKNNRFNVEFSIPRIGRTPLTLYSKAFYDQRDLETRQKILKAEAPRTPFLQPYALGIQRYGMTVAFGTQIRTNARLVADMTLQNAQSYPRNSMAETMAKENIGMASLGAQFILDTRNSSFLPSEGRYMNIRYTSARGIKDDVNDFWQLVGSFEENISTGNDTTLQISAIAGTSSQTIPFSEKFFLGGMGNAYSYRFLGLKENDLIGNNIAVAGAQFRYKSPVQLIFPTSLIGAYNIGNVWQLRSEMSICELVQGVGAGLVWETPIGPARLTASKSFAFETEDVKNKAKLDFSRMVFYFSLGHDF